MQVLLQTSDFGIADISSVEERKEVEQAELRVIRSSFCHLRVYGPMESTVNRASKQVFDPKRG